jgi:hypothetical protein
MDEVTSSTDLQCHSKSSFMQNEKRRALAFLAFNFAAATTLGVQRCFLQEDTAETGTVEVLPESSTKLRKTSPEIQARLDALLCAARHDIIEDGRANAITEYLSDLFIRDFRALVPALTTLIESERTPPILAAEVLKELGRIRHAASHAARRWLLERALKISTPFVRDGAGLGLARLADPAALRYLRKAIESEPNAEIKADLQLVVDELAESVR